MQFVVIAFDGTDEQALERRMAHREEHLAMCRKLKATGNYHSGGAMLDDTGKMIGSVCFYEFASRAEFDIWLKTEPYIRGNVWQKVEVHPFRIPPHNIK